MGSALCVITARGGSKRIPRKNLRDFCGKPIMAYSIEAALESELFDEVMVSTDDDEIAGVAHSYGASVPFRRSAGTSDDFATTADVLLEVLEEYRSRGREFDVLCCLYPTAPFVSSQELQDARRAMLLHKAPAIAAVTTFDYPPQRAFCMTDDGRIEYAYPEYALTRSQDLPQLTHDCGRFYFCDTRSLREHGTLIVPCCIGFMIDSSKVQDIDTEEDWMRAEFKYRWLTGCVDSHYEKAM